MKNVIETSSFLEEAFAQRSNLLLVVHRHLHVALDHDGLELLGAHHRRQPRATGRALLVVHDGSGQGHHLPCRADGAYLDLLAMAFFQGIFQIRNTHSPEVAGVQ